MIRSRSSVVSAAAGAASPALAAPPAAAMLFVSGRDRLVAADAAGAREAARLAHLARRPAARGGKTLAIRPTTEAAR